MDVVTELKREVLIYASYLGAGEPMTAEDAAASLTQTIGRVCADRNTTHTTVALIAMLLAKALEEREPK